MFLRHPAVRLLISQPSLLVPVGFGKSGLDGLEARLYVLVCLNLLEH